MSGGGDFLQYQLYKEAARTNVWGDSGADLLNPGVSPSSAPRVVTVYGRVFAGQDQVNTGHLDRLLKIYFFQAGVSVWRHQHGPVQHASELDIVDVARAAGEEALVLHAPHRLPDAKAVHVFLLRCMADHTRAGEKGKSRWWMPSGRSASITAFATAGSAPVVRLMVMRSGAGSSVVWATGLSDRIQASAVRPPHHPADRTTQ